MTAFIPSTDAIAAVTEWLDTVCERDEWSRASTVELWRAYVADHIAGRVPVMLESTFLTVLTGHIPGVRKDAGTGPVEVNAVLGLRMRGTR